MEVSSSAYLIGILFSFTLLFTAIGISLKEAGQIEKWYNPVLVYLTVLISLIAFFGFAWVVGLCLTYIGVG
jgi:hypothetical protein